MFNINSSKGRQQKADPQLLFYKLHLLNMTVMAIISLIVTGGLFVLAYYAMTSLVVDQNRDVAYMLLGSLATGWTLILGAYFRNNASSTISNVIRGVDEDGDGMPDVLQKGRTRVNKKRAGPTYRRAARPISSTPPTSSPSTQTESEPKG